MSDAISKFLSERIDAGDFPSAVYLVAEKGRIVMHEALGNAVVEPELIVARADTIYDLASLTKVLVTGLLAARLVDDKKMGLEDRISDYLTVFDVDDKRDVTIRDLLAHTSGFRNWLPFYLIANLKSQIPDVIVAMPRDHAVGSKVVYSDLNFIVLGYLIESLSGGQSLRQVADNEIFGPLGLASTGYNPIEDDPLRKTSIAASEKGNCFERQTCAELGYFDGGANSPVSVVADRDTQFRRDLIWGEVHDGNAYFMGGVAGHAGLFSTAEEVFKIASQFLPNYTGLLEPETCMLFRKNFTPGMDEHRSFAFQLASTPESAAGVKMPPESFGHLGFTGTSVWIDPVKERIFVLLTNRTHNREIPFVNINSVRRRFHDLAIDILDKKT